MGWEEVGSKGKNSLRKPKSSAYYLWLLTPKNQKFNEGKERNNFTNVRENKIFGIRFNPNLVNLFIPSEVPGILQGAAIQKSPYFQRT